MAREIGADFVVLDPAVPLGIVGPRLELPYMVVLHGAEVTVPGRLPLSRLILSRVLKTQVTSSLLASIRPQKRVARLETRCLSR